MSSIRLSHALVVQWNDICQQDSLPLAVAFVREHGVYGKDINDRTLLHTAAHFGALKVVLLLLGYDPSLAQHKDVMQEIPLHRAFEKGPLGLIEALLRVSDVNAPTLFQVTPLHLAYERCPQAVEVLLHAGAHPFALDNKGMQPHQWAKIKPLIA